MKTRIEINVLRISLRFAIAAATTAVCHAQSPTADDFNPGVDSYDSVVCLAVQADGKILLGGYITTLGGRARRNLGRLYPDGGLDTAFNPGADYSVSSFAVQADGKILVGGSFTTLGGQPRTGIGRLNSDGTLDTTLNSSAGGFNPNVFSLAVQADGKILVGGSFTTLGGQLRSCIGRLNPDGSLDTTFNPGASGGNFPSVGSLAVQANGKILVGGQFTTLGGHSRTNIGRLNADGSLDTAFNPGADNSVFLTLQADGKILVGGEFTTLGGQPRSHLGRLDADGSLDTAFNPGAGIDSFPSVRSLAVQADGKILVGGDFTMLGGVARSGIGRLNADGSATQSLFYDDSTVTWLRGDASPEIWRTSFESSTNAGADWIHLGEGTRINGGWQLAGISVATNGSIRARGFVSGSDEGSRWFVESNLGPQPPLITSQPVSRNLIPGGIAELSVVAVGTAPLTYQWRQDGVAVAGATAASLTLTNLQGANAGGYDVVVSNAFGSVTSVVALLTVNLATLDLGFNPYAVGGRYDVYSFAEQADGKILMGGWFTTVDGRARSDIARLNRDGTVDGTFDPGADGPVYCLAAQPDGKILAGGAFTNLGGQACSRIGRLNTDGTLDTTFNPEANSTVYCLAVQSDGNVVVGGAFWTLDGQARSRIGRLNSDGTLDTAFDPGASGSVYSLAMQADGKILVGGSFTTLGGQPRDRIGRLNSDGTLDTTFNPGAGGGDPYLSTEVPYQSPVVYSLAVQADGKILVGGSFTTLGGQPRHYIGRLHSDGMLDTDFDQGTEGSSSDPPYVYSLAVQTDGKILVGGNFPLLGGQPRNRIGRLNSDGTLDTTFHPLIWSWYYASVYALTLQGDGNILVGGDFTNMGDSNEDLPVRGSVGRLNNTGPATQSLSHDGSTITWLRGGTSPEVWRTTFEASTNRGGDWFSLGHGTRISGGWQLTGIAVASDANIRARGYATGGFFNGSGWFMESIIGPALMYSQPLSRTNNAGTVATFSVSAVGTSPGYQWLKDGLVLSDSGNLSGVQTSTLAVSNVLGGDAGGYSVIVSNVFGSVTSHVATLTVVDPLITRQPVSRNVNLGDTAAFNVTVVGTAPLGYQWRQDGIAVANGTAASLTITNVQGADAGDYDVIVTNAFGTVTSLVARLSVNLATVDPGFNPGINGLVYSFVVQGDGRILVGGSFTTLGGQPRSRIGRLYSTGTLDPAFNPGTSGPVWSLAVQTDGKFLVGGSFTTLAGQSRTNIGRLNPDGTLDPVFDPGAGGLVYSLALQADGKILVGGSFTTLGGQPRANIGRLNSDGTLDTDFDPGVGGPVYSLAVQADGKILVGGTFTTLGGQTRSSIGRINSDGPLDTGFDPGANGSVYSLSVQADGKILVGGSFTTLGGQTRNRIARLNSDGTLDTTFNPGANNSVYALVLQADGKILVGGDFSTLAGQTRNRIARLNSDGTLDFTFDSGANSSVYSLAVQAYGDILIGGSFGTLGGQPRSRIGRLNRTDPATQNLTYDGSTITWLRGGTSPEVWRTTFEASSNHGADWVSLGEGARISGGWELVGVSVESNATLRARGFLTGGRYNGSSWFAESIIGPAVMPRLMSPSWSAGQFQVSLAGTLGATYWLQSATNLMHWSTVADVTLSASPLAITVPAPAEWSFYQLTTPAP